MTDWMRLAPLELALWATAYVSNTLTDVDGLGNFVIAFNCPPLGLSTSEWADLLIELADRGYITFHADGRRMIRPIAPQVTPTDTEVAAALLQSESKLTYALTPVGGKVWEDAAQADWMNYLDAPEGYGPQWEPVWGSINREEDPFAISDEEPSETPLEEVEEWGGPALERAQVLLSSQRRDLMEARYAIDADVLKIVMPGSRQDGEVQPWHPTYWKTLPLGYRLGYSVYSPPERKALSLPCTTNEERDEAQGFTPSWYRSVFPPHRMSN